MFRSGNWTSRQLMVYYEAEHRYLMANADFDWGRVDVEKWHEYLLKLEQLKTLSQFWFSMLKQFEQRT